jgi:hypothetical protein
MHSKFPLLATHNKIWEIPYKKHLISNTEIQFIAPCIANGKGKSGVIIADINNGEFEAIQINKQSIKRIFSINGRKEKKN